MPVFSTWEVLEVSVVDKRCSMHIHGYGRLPEASEARLLLAGKYLDRGFDITSGPDDTHRQPITLEMEVEVAASPFKLAMVEYGKPNIDTYTISLILRPCGLTI